MEEGGVLPVEEDLILVFRTLRDWEAPMERDGIWDVC